MLPLRNTDNMIFGNFFIGVTDVSVSGKESTSVGGRVLNFPVGPIRKRSLEADASIEFKEGQSNTIKARFYLNY